MNTARVWEMQLNICQRANSICLMYQVKGGANCWCWWLNFITWMKFHRFSIWNAINCGTACKFLSSQSFTPSNRAFILLQEAMWPVKDYISQTSLQPNVAIQPLGGASRKDSSKGLNQLDTFSFPTPSFLPGKVIIRQGWNRGHM